MVKAFFHGLQNVFSPSQIVLLTVLFFSFLYILLIIDCSFDLFFWMRASSQIEANHYRGKVVWIVGASSGIGEQLALRLAKFSPLLILSARTEDELRRVRRKCKHANFACEVTILPMDILDFAELPGKVAAAHEIYGQPVDIVVLNAGRSQRAEWTDIDPSVDAECFQINAIAPTQLARCVLKHRGLHPTLEKLDHLQFVIVSSVAGLLPAVLSASYGAAKAALNQYFRLLAVEMGEKDVRVSIVNPSLVYAPNNPLNAFTSEKDKSNGEVITGATNAHMNASRAAELISHAAMYEIPETVISTSTLIILLTYLSAPLPVWLTKMVLPRDATGLRKWRQRQNKVETKASDTEKVETPSATLPEITKTTRLSVEKEKVEVGRFINWPFSNMGKLKRK